MLPIFYINLASRPDRRAFMEEQFAAIGIAAERVEAVTPETLDSYWHELSLRVPAARRLRPSELACTLSHRAIWQIMKTREIDAAVILEDDMVISSALARLAREPGDYSGIDILRLETRLRPIFLGRTRMAGGGVAARQMFSQQLGTGGYIISQSTSAQLLGDPRLANLPIDRYLFGRNGPCLRWLNIYQSVPAMCVASNLASVATRKLMAVTISVGNIDSNLPTPITQKTLRTRLLRTSANLCHVIFDLFHFVRKGALGELNKPIVNFSRN